MSYTGSELVSQQLKPNFGKTEYEIASAIKKVLINNEELGTKFDIDNDAMVQIWITDDDHDNLTAHMGDDVRKELYGKTYDEYKYNKCIPGYCPARLLENKKEGDHVTFTFPTGVTVECELCQLGYRYRRWGRFEEAFNHVVPGKYRRAS